MLTRKGFLTALLGAVATACGCASRPKPKTPCDGGNIMYARAQLGKSLDVGTDVWRHEPVYMISDLHFGNDSRVAVSAKTYVQARTRAKAQTSARPQPFAAPSAPVEESEGTQWYGAATLPQDMELGCKSDGSVVWRRVQGYK